MSSPKSCCGATCICICLLLLVCATSFLAISLSLASKRLVIFTPWPRSEDENLPSVEIDSCGHLLTRCSITLSVSSHPRKVVTFHVRLLDRERLQVDVAWQWHKQKHIFGFLLERYSLPNFGNIFFVLLLHYLGLPHTSRKHRKKIGKSKLFSLFSTSFWQPLVGQNSLQPICQLKYLSYIFFMVAHVITHIRTTQPVLIILITSF